MNRRAFLGSLAGALAGATLDPERLLWRPGAKTIVDLGGIVPISLADPVSVTFDLDLPKLVCHPNAFALIWPEPRSGPPALKLGDHFTFAGRYEVNSERFDRYIVTGVVQAPEEVVLRVSPWAASPR